MTGFSHCYDPSHIKRLLVGLVVLFGASLVGQGIEIKNGVNIQASYYNHGSVNLGWDLMEQYPEIESVRIEIEPYRVHQAREWIREAHEHGYQVIATYHDSNQLGTDDQSQLIKAAEWWRTHYHQLAASGPIIINIMNEWGSHNIDAKAYASAYNTAIAIIREVYSSALIIDAPGFGQATRIAADAYPYLLDTDIIYSVHIYTNAFNILEERWLSQEDLSYLDATGAPCMVGEFCDTSAGGADWCSIIDHCYENGWPLIGWAWNGDGKDMNMIEPHWRDDPQAESFRPTEFMDVIIDKLSGIACYSQPDEDCDPNNIGGACDDDNAYTINDRYNEYCHCIGTFTSELNYDLTESDLMIYPNPVSPGQELSIELFQIHSLGQINVVNSLGETLFTHRISRNQDRILLDTGHLSAGIYWVSFLTQNEVVVTKTLVVF